MKVQIDKGKYILAVSGGVDSMVLLDLLSNLPGVELVVAHFNHGIRPDAAKDEMLVRDIAKKLGLAFEVGYGGLGTGASEETAREARYKFLEKVRVKHGAKAIITAHHQDDLIETAIINLIRGTGRRGLVSIMQNPRVVRPLLAYDKQAIVSYARAHHLKWSEDLSNQDDKYLRNYVRNNVLPGLTGGQRKEIISNIEKVAELENILNPKIAILSQKIYHDNSIDRRAFTILPIEVGNELMLYWLRQEKVQQPSKKMVNRLNLAIRSSAGGTIHNVKGNLQLHVNQSTARFVSSL